MSQYPTQFGYNDPMARPQKGWFGRNWVWLLIVFILGLILICGGCIGGMVYFAMSTLKSLPPYQDSIAQANASPAVQAELGTPLDPSWLIQGNATTVNGVMSLDLKIPVTGPKGSGTIDFSAKVVNDQWTFTSLKVLTPGKTIDLLAESGTTPTPPAPSPSPDPDAGQPPPSP